MKHRLIRFIILSALGFVLGTGMALWQTRGELHAAVIGSAATIVSETKSTPVPQELAGLKTGGRQQA